MPQEIEQTPLELPEQPQMPMADITEADQKKGFFCDTNGENYYLFGICIGKVVTYWVGGIIASLGGLGGVLGYLFG